MLKRLAFSSAALALVLATPALGQPQPPGPDVAFMQQAITALRTQRERALDEAATLTAQLAKLQADLAQVTKERDDLKAKVEAKPPEAKP